MTRWLTPPLALLTLLLPATAQAGGWTQAEGAHYVKIWNRFISGSNGFLANGEIDELEGSYTDTSLNLYAEYGLTDDWTLVGYALPVGYAIGHQPDGASEDDRQLYVGAAWAGVRRALLSDGPIKLAVEGHYGYTPSLGEEAVASGVVAGEPYVYVPAVESHRLDGELQLGYGLSGGMWLSLSGGYRQLFSDAELDPVVYGFAQYGWSGEQVVVEGHLILNHPLGDVTGNNIAGSGQTRYVGLGFGLSYWFTPHVAANVGLDGAPYAASNAATPSVLVGVELR